MPPPLPFSLSPHICILSSPDLEDLLTASTLPQLSEILQSFSPLPQVTTRTTTLASVPHKAFALRFSNLSEIEAACREDEEERAARTLDWIGARINSRSAQWVEDMEKLAGKQPTRVPWWEELKRCVEGDHVPSKTETWNHPAAIILAVSTNTTNPLQVISNLHARPIELPAWVDPTYLRYTLIVHPKESTLSDEEAGALFNAVKKQYGLHSYLLTLDMPNPPPAPVPVPTAKPRLPVVGDSSEMSTKPMDTSTRSGVSIPSGVNTLRMNEKDIQHTAKFTREFLVMSLIPWMEKCVMDWNENFVSTRRLPSRLFSSTRRLFGSPSPSPTPQPTHRSTPSRASTYTAPGAAQPNTGSPSQQRRLAEFATVLGDFKLAVTVWETLSKEGKGGSDIMPLILSPSHAIPLHVTNALTAMFSASSEPPARLQLQAILSAVRWEIGIDPSDFASDILEGERWLVWAAGSAEETPSALLLAHAALISSRKLALRRSALWYLVAANKLEKCGIPLTTYFLRKARDLYVNRPKKELSPSFWDSEGQRYAGLPKMDGLMPVIDHPLGRLLYSTGHVQDAVKIFLCLLEASTLSTSSTSTSDYETETAEVYLEDFRIAFEHLRANTPNLGQQSDITLPFTFCVASQSHLKFENDDNGGEQSEWQEREETWNRYNKSRGIYSRFTTDYKAYVDETFWVDLVIQNPLNVDITLANLTLTILESNVIDPSPSKVGVIIETIESMTIAAKGTRTIPISITATRPASLTITHATYSFLSLLPSTESLAVRGKRLYDTAAQRQTPTYAPDVMMQVTVAEASCRLLARVADDAELDLYQGEIQTIRLWLSNVGVKPISEVWLVTGSNNIWLDEGDEEGITDEKPMVERIHSSNSLGSYEPFNLPLGPSSILGPGQSREIALTFHALDVDQREIPLLLLHRETSEAGFTRVRIKQTCQVHPLFRITSLATPSTTLEEMYSVQLQLQNISTTIAQITQISTVSPSWIPDSSAHGQSGALFPLQVSRFIFGVNPWDSPSGCEDTLKFVTNQLSSVVQGKTVDLLNPPSLDLCYSNVIQITHPHPFGRSAISKFIHSGKRHSAIKTNLASYPHIPAHTHPHIFSLFDPVALDVLAFWEITAENRWGNLLISGLNLGASHSPLREIIDTAENAKLTRSMYAETRRQREELLQDIRNSEWNKEMNPLHVSIQANNVEHDFGEGPCRLRVLFMIRNYSSTLKSRFVLKLNDASKPEFSSFGEEQLASFSGRLTFRACLEPRQHTTCVATAWIHRPGIYSLGAWRMDSDVLETLPNNSVERVRFRYAQKPSLDDTPSVIIRHVRRTHMQ
ncbi:ER-golgi trafficking TRAPP I complex 85 kDa subunit-domain-containing protein [Lentinula raphanica]|uniref:ER-golgi trafficking TRAPP I complex 85 kDa subunit-domain-containing protein n=1 Tax=Lentinula raphanica TaxID=153919 RepID=A0AA38PJW6_9AGAR|nr:ER-golgi trafficking TRAPP I complex 85 kDa subunit-domain-containing protein [Lentinula raphanica]